MMMNYTKVLSIVFFACLFFGGTGCDIGTNAQNNKNQELVGIWKLEPDNSASSREIYNVESIHILKDGLAVIYYPEPLTKATGIAATWRVEFGRLYFFHDNTYDIYRESNAASAHSVGYYFEYKITDNTLRLKLSNEQQESGTVVYKKQHRSEVG